MTKHDTLKYTMLSRVREFGDTHRERLAHSPLAREQFARVAATVETLTGYAVQQTTAAREGRAARTTARRALVTQLGAIVRTARALAEDTPGLEATFRVPAPHTDVGLLAAGRLFLQAAEAIAGRFVEHGLPSTFLADLRGLVERFEHIVHGREAEQDGRTASKARIAAALATGTAAVRRLDAIVANHLGDDAAVVATWQRVRRIGGWKKKRSDAASAPEPEVPASPSVPPADPAPPPAPNA